MFTPFAFIKTEAAGSPVVSDGLLLWWDAGDSDSWDGVSSTVYDLSGNGNDGTITGTVSYSSDFGGIFSWLSAGKIVSSTPNLSTSNNTVMGSYRQFPSSNDGRIIAAANNNWLAGSWNVGVENYYAEGTIRLSASPADTNWRILAANGDIDTDTWELYINNTFSISSGGGTEGPDGISIGEASGGQEQSDGQLGFLLVYNRVLSTTEMTQNYDYYKSRYGLS